MCGRWESCLTPSKSSKRWQSRVVTGSRLGREVFLLFPQTYMNLSGDAVSKAMHDLKLPLSSLIVVHDDIDLTIGQYKLKNGGGMAGHKGLISITERLGTKDYARLRIGIGPRPAGEISSFVLRRFSNDELSVMLRCFQGISNSLDAWLESGIEPAMNQFNGPEAGNVEKNEKD